ncbi:MAG: hypothetical protein IT379_12560, partial [Deltaproteobacteria bacterium]|nr:hypothetical protein [Deltaproteobacteria bacterium]
MKRSTTIVSVLLASACASPSTAIRREGPVVASRPAAAADTEPTGPSSSVAMLPTLGPKWLVSVDPDRSRLVVLGSLRARLHDGALQLGEGRPSSPIYVVARAATGWLFVTRDGLVLRSTTFTGPLDRVGELPTGIRTWRTFDVGRLAMVDADGALWTTDGTTAPERIDTLPEPGIANDVVFASADRGAAVMDGGALVSTHDGGRSWQPVQLAGEAATSVVLLDGQLVVRTSAGERVLDESDRLVARVGTGDPTFFGGPEVAAIELKLLRRLPFLLESWGVVDARGRGLISDGADLLIVSPDTGDIERRVVAALPRGCSLHPWGDAVGAICADGSLRRLEGEQAFSPVATRSDLSSVVLAADGRRAVAVCGDAPCVLRPGAAQWEMLALPDTDLRNPRVVAIHGSLVAVEATSPTYDTVTATFDIDSGEVERLRASGPELDQPLSPDWIRFAVDGTLYGTVPLPSGGRVMAIGRPGAPLAVHAMPVGTERVTFADARRGIASGPTLARVWRTLDGGSTWHAVAPSVDGRAAAVPLFSDNPFECTDRGCAIGGLIIRGWEPRLTAPPERLVSRLETAAPATAAQAYAGRSRPAWRCDATGSVRAQIAAASRVRGIPEGARTESLLGPRSNALVHMWRAGEEPASSTAAAPEQIMVSWRGVDARGAFSGATRRSAVAYRHPGCDHSENRSVLALRAVTRQGALLERLHGGMREILWARHGGGVEALELPRLMGDSPRVHSVLTLEDGGLVFAVLGIDDRNVVVLRTSPDGAVLARRSFRWRERAYASMLGVARQGDVIGFAAEHPRGDSLLFQPLDPSASVRRIAIDVRRPAVACDEDADEGLLVVTG